MSQKCTKQQNVTKTHTNIANCNKNAQGKFKFVVHFCYLLGIFVTTWAILSPFRYKFALLG